VLELLPQVLVDSLLLAGLYTLMAVGLSLGFGVTRIINFAHGECVMLGAYGAFWFFHLWGVDPLIALPLLVVAGFVGGWGLFKVAIEKVLEAPHLNQILLTFGIALALQHVAVVLWTGDVRSVTPSYALATWVFDDLFIIHGRLIAFGVAIVLVLGLIAWLEWSESGRAVRAVAQNHDAAILMGIDPARMYALAFAINTALAVASGVVISFLINITPFMGFPVLLKGIAIVILGGLGSVMGTVIGAIALALAETVVAYYVPEGSGWAEGVAFTLIIAILLVRPTGIAGKSQIA
jgi:branched-chain amino acid transport system permease protein